VIALFIAKKKKELKTFAANNPLNGIRNFQAFG
jgi:hypothetical protein